MLSLLVLSLAAVVPRQPTAPAVTIVAPAAPGGGWDQLARTMQRVLEREGLASRVVVENIPGAAGTVGLARFVSSRRGDGSALLVTGLVMAGGVAQNASPVTLRDATPIARLVGEYEAIAVPAASPYRTIGDLVAAFREDPGAVSWGGGSAGGTDQILVDLIAREVGVDPRRVNYVAFAGGGEARTALLGAQVTAGVSGIGEFAELAAAGQVRILAVSAAERVPGTAAPTLRESGVDAVVANWRGVLAPPSLSPADRARLEHLMAAMVRSPSWRGEIARRGWEDLHLAGDAFGRFVDAEARRVEVLVARRRGEAATLAGPHLNLPLWLFLGLVVAVGVSLGRPPARAERATGSFPRVALVVAGFVLSAALGDLLGFVVASTLLFAATALAFAARPLGRVLLAGLLFCGGVFVLFRFGLDVPLPVGRVWPG